MVTKKIKKTMKVVKKNIAIYGITEGTMDWLISMDDKNKLYSVHGSNKHGHEVSNIWDNERKIFLLEDFMPILQQTEPIIIFGSNGIGYKIFSCRNQGFLPLQGKNFNRCFIFKDMVVLANHFAEVAVLSRENNYNYPLFRYIADHVIDTEDDEEFEIKKSRVQNCLIIKSNKDTQQYLYDISNHELIKVM